MGTRKIHRSGVDYNNWLDIIHIKLGRDGLDSRCVLKMTDSSPSFESGEKITFRLTAGTSVNLSKGNSNPCTNQVHWCLISVIV